MSMPRDLKRIEEGGIRWWGWTIMVLVVLLFLCTLLKCCNTDWNTGFVAVPPDDGRPVPEQPIASPPTTRLPVFPDRPGIHPPIDTGLIIPDPDNPIQRPIVSNLINVYVQDTTDLQRFSGRVFDHFLPDSVVPNYYAEEYKRVQFKVTPSERTRIKDELSSAFDETVKFVTDEVVIPQARFEAYDDPAFADGSHMTWFYSMIGLENAWQRTTGDPSIIVAILDDSFDAGHPEITGSIVEPWNIFQYDDQVTDHGGRFKHGTHVAGTVAGALNNGIGLAGVAPGCRIMPVQVSDGRGTMTTSSLLDGVFYALKNGARVINLSLGLHLPGASSLPHEEQERLAKTLFLEEAEMWDEVFRIAKEEDVLIVQAAGNDGILAAIDPMKRSSASLVVGAVDETKTPTDFSNLGDVVRVFAPGVDIYSTTPNNGLEPMSGTSMASPIVSGCIALMMSFQPDLSIDRIRTIIEETGTEAGHENGRIIRIDRALESIAS